ncbi:Arabinogalactan peptide 20 [Acorus gramineus]|uniref:Arabinogalactan peptide 20 n=1 Tax=Acorus gramineus TaxID=55184 RepID=A0AAV9BJB5_ACOGR|nr:Arabinogalactan peptide 20 [Acorus gramineus]
MAIVRGSFMLMAIAALIFSIVFPAAVHGHEGHHHAPAPAPATHAANDDQGIACMLMMVALVLTYLIHPLEASPYKLF